VGKKNIYDLRKHHLELMHPQQIVDVVGWVKRIGQQVREGLETWSDPKATAWNPSRIPGFDIPMTKPPDA